MSRKNTSDAASIPPIESSAGWQQTQGWTQGAATSIRREEVTVSVPGGPLSIHGDAAETALLIDGQIAAFHWDDNDGSVGQHLVRKVSDPSGTAIAAFRQAVEQPVAPGETLAAHFSVVLRLLAPGKYQLHLEQIPADSYIVELTIDPATTIGTTNFYPGYGAMIATQPASALSAPHVESLSAAIRNGARPTVITLSSACGWCEFIIDGHHKVSAYRRATVPICRLAIQTRPCTTVARRSEAVRSEGPAPAGKPGKKPGVENLTGKPRKANDTIYATRFSPRTASRLIDMSRSMSTRIRRLPSASPSPSR